MVGVQQQGMQAETQATDEGKGREMMGFISVALWRRGALIKPLLLNDHGAPMLRGVGIIKKECCTFTI